VGDDALVEGVDEGDGSLGWGNKFRLERFGKAMSGSCAWDPPGGLLNSRYLPLFTPKVHANNLFPYSQLRLGVLTRGEHNCRLRRRDQIDVYAVRKGVWASEICGAGSGAGY
jgi:hypothetical protein